MPIRNATPVTWVPKGCSDAVSGTNVFKGAMQSLVNLVPDPENIGLFVPRPAAIQLTDFTGFNNPGFVSCIFVVGNLVYGMIATDANAGKDEPFVYDLDAGAFVAVSGVTGAKSPFSPNSTGAWVPPTMAVIGTKVMVTHPGFNGTANKIGWFDISVPATPAWNAGDTTTNALPFVPAAVFNFYDRAYYAVKNTLWYSDVLVPTTITNATQTLTCGDTNNIIALSGLPLLTQLGGIIQSMIAFKTGKTIFQITGDAALSNLSNSIIAGGVGTESPLSICPSPTGLSYISDHGLRQMDQTGKTSAVIGADGSGISVPFINAVTPTRVCAAFNVNVMRITTQNAFVSTLPYQDWWYDTDQQAWCGPHTFPASLIQAWSGSFIMTPVGIEASLWQSDFLPVETSAYIENGTQLRFDFRPVLLPLSGTMNQNAVIETTQGLSFSSVGGDVDFYAYDENGNLLDFVTKTFTVTPSLWGAFLWGLGIWGGALLRYQQFRIPWSVPIVFSQFLFRATGDAIPGFRIGNTYFRYQVLGYTVYN